ncbi:MAG: 50S ribosomal protein L18 [Chitinispirillaceae bacterium]|nr:50S ribosomal protein L18 [Chitinispirillaceae bacterium]
MNISKKRVVSRASRALRVRKKVSGTSERPRLCVRRSLNHIYAQLVDDEKGITIVQVGSSGKERAAQLSNKKKSDISRIVGELLAEKAKEKGVTKVVFDRKGYLYHGRVKALADAARSKGLLF